MRSSPAQETTLSADPLLSEIELPHERTYFPLGFPARFATNSQLVLDAAEQSWGANDQRFDHAAVRLDIGVMQPDSRRPDPPVFRARGHLLSIVSDPANSIVCDMRAGFAFGWVSRETAANESFFRFYFLDAAALTLIEQQHLAPVHGALVARDGIGVLLSGDSGAGKSTLALACALAGWDYIADDATYLLRERSDLFAIGNSHTLRLRPDVAQRFSEIGSRLSIIRPNGKCAIELFTRDIPSFRTLDGVAIRHLVRLHRSPALRPSLVPERTDPDAPFLKRDVRYGDERVVREQFEAYQRLTNARWWTLRYRDFEDAVPLLNSLVKE